MGIESPAFEDNKNEKMSDGALRQQISERIKKRESIIQEGDITGTTEQERRGEMERRSEIAHEIENNIRRENPEIRGLSDKYLEKAKGEKIKELHDNSKYAELFYLNDEADVVGKEFSRISDAQSEAYKENDGRLKLLKEKRKNIDGYENQTDVEEIWRETEYKIKSLNAERAKWGLQEDALKLARDTWQKSHPELFHSKEKK